MKLKYLFISRGPGETSQAVATAKYLLKKNQTIVFCLRQKSNKNFLKEKNFSTYITPTPEEFKKIVKKERPDIIIYCNSKIWPKNKEIQKKDPFPNIPSFAIDSNWLFDESLPYTFIEWGDKYFINFPQKIFELGLKKNGGGFEIPENNFKKIEVVGFIPSYEKISKKKKEQIRNRYNLKDDEKLVFAYFGGFGTGHRLWVLKYLLRALKLLREKGIKIKLVYVGPSKRIGKKNIEKKWIFNEKKIDSDFFFEILSSSDLVFQHQGLATLTQAISANVPVITNVKEFPDSPLPKIHINEVNPFHRAGLCLMQKKGISLEKVSENIKMMLFNKEKRKEMIKKQKKHYQKGEPNIYKFTQNFIKE